jgi:uncharacterized RmlC-like cupin family protein
MSEDRRVRLVRPEDRTGGTQTPGMHREAAVTTDRSWAGHVTTDAGMTSGWHHHGDYESHIYVLSGTLRMESGPGGRDVVEAHEGDFLFVPAHTIHREGNPDDTDGAAVVIRAGRGDPVFNVDGPDPG